MKYASIVKGLTKMVSKLEAYQTQCVQGIQAKDETIANLNVEKAELVVEQSKAQNCAKKLKEIVG
jgi:hypothetical protein